MAKEAKVDTAQKVTPKSGAAKGGKFEEAMAEAMASSALASSAMALSLKALEAQMEAFMAAKVSTLRFATPLCPRPPASARVACLPA